jgi:hypothetical protein
VGSDAHPYRNPERRLTGFGLFWQADWNSLDRKDGRWEYTEQDPGSKMEIADDCPRNTFGRKLRKRDPSMVR